MAYQEHPVFRTPPRETIIWRYINIEQLLSMLERRSLFFPSVDSLRKHDPYEGAMSEVNAVLDTIAWEKLSSQQQAQIKTKELLIAYQKARRDTRPIILGQRRITFASCWHAQPEESSAMWKLYTRNQKGLAIRSTCGRFIDSVAAYTEFTVFIGLVNYIDYLSQFMDESNGFVPYVHKRVQFKYESELRAIIWTAENGKNSIDPGSNPYADKSGIYVQVDLDTIIEQLCLGPETEEWEMELVMGLLDRYGIEKPVVKSILATRPSIA